MKRYVLSMLLTISVLSNVVSKTSEAEEFQTEYEYNIFTADTWTISPYLFFGYSPTYYSYDKNKFNNTHNIPLRLANGFIAGGGFTINKNWSFEISVTHTRNNGSKSNDGSNIASVKAINTVVDMDVYLRLPFTFMKNRLNTYITGGMNIVNFATEKEYRNVNTNVLASRAKEENKIAFGLNAGIAFSYNITDHIYVKTTLRKLWVLQTAPVKHGLLYNISAGINF